MHVCEESPPTEADRQLLLTTLPVENDAERSGTVCNGELKERVYFVLVSGCKELENRTAERLQRAAAMVVARRAASDGTTCRPRSCSRMSNSGFWRCSPRRKDAPKNLGEAVFLVAASAVIASGTRSAGSLDAAGGM